MAQTESRRSALQRGLATRRVRWNEDCDMENLVTETVADQGLTVNVEDETGLAAALPRNHHDDVVREELTNGDANAVDAEATVDFH